MNIYYVSKEQRQFSKSPDLGMEKTTLLPRVRYGSPKRETWMSFICSVEVGGNGFQAQYGPDPRDGRVIQYQTGGNNLVSYASRAPVILPGGVVLDASLWGENLPPGTYQAEVVMSAGLSHVYIYKPFDKEESKEESSE